MKKLVYGRESKIRLVLDLTSEASCRKLLRGLKSNSRRVLVVSSFLSYLRASRYRGHRTDARKAYWTKLHHGCVERVSANGPSLVLCMIMPKQSAPTPFLHDHRLAYLMDQSNCHHYAVNAVAIPLTQTCRRSLSNQLCMKIKTPQG